MEQRVSVHHIGGSYRLYFLDSSNRISGVEELACGSDDEACRAAGELGYRGGMEIWFGARLVARAERGERLTPAPQA
jgi:hypothetical protein